MKKYLQTINTILLIIIASIIASNTYSQVVERNVIDYETQVRRSQLENTSTMVADSTLINNNVIEQNRGNKIEERPERARHEMIKIESRIQEVEQNEIHVLTFPFEIEDKELEEEIMKILERKFISVIKSDKTVTVESPAIISLEDFKMNISQIVSRIQSSTKK